MHGTMLWFNQAKDLGSIVTDEGERLSVRGSGFADGKRPEGRCAGEAVVFESGGAPDAPEAQDVRFVPVVAARRARTRRSTYRIH